MHFSLKAQLHLSAIFESFSVSLGSSPAYPPALDWRLAPNVPLDDTDLDKQAKEASQAPGHQRNHIHEQQGLVYFYTICRFKAV